MNRDRIADEKHATAPHQLLKTAEHLYTQQAAQQADLATLQQPSCGRTFQRCWILRARDGQKYDSFGHKTLFEQVSRPPNVKLS